MHVLLIDDDIGSLLGMQIAIESIGYTCDTYSDPLKVVQDCLEKELIKKYDAIITDFSMPTIDGIRLARLIRCLEPRLKIVIVSGFANEETVQAISENGFGTLLYKPVCAAKLAQTLQN